MPILVLWVLCAFFLGLFVDFRRTSGGQSIVERERESLKKRVVLLWVCSVPSLPAGPWNTLDEHFQL